MAGQKASAGNRSTGLGFAGARLAVVKRAKAVALLPIVAAAAAFAIFSVVPDRYSASVLIQIDPRPASSSDTDAKAPSRTHAFEDERLAIEKQIEVLRSPMLIDGVADALRLSNDPEFQTRPPVARLSSPFKIADAKTVAREALADHLIIKRVHNSYLIRVRFTSRDAAKAQRIANAVAAAYVAQERSAPSNVETSSRIAAKPTASEKVFASLLAQYGLDHTLSAARIVEPAYMPRHPAGPKRARIVTTVAVSTFVLMLMIAVLLERAALSRNRNVEKVLACPHMSSLPTVASREDANALARNARLILAEPECRYAEAVRNVCRELSARANGETGRVILVTSALPGEGAEAFASNIAHHLAIAGQTSLLVDCDFRAKGLTRQLTPQNASGLLDQVASHSPVEDAILRDGLTGVHFLPASGPAPVQLTIPTVLRSVEFSAAFGHLKARFPTIVLSAPPLLPFADAQALADLADQIVFLTAWQRTPRDLARNALISLGANQRKVVGAVLTDIADEQDAGFMSFGAIFEEILRASRIPALDHAA